MAPIFLAGTHSDAILQSVGGDSAKALHIHGEIALLLHDTFHSSSALPFVIRDKQGQVLASHSAFSLMNHFSVTLFHLFHLEAVFCHRDDEVVAAAHL